MKQEEWLLELTALPTASGREDHVIDWVRRWCGRRAWVQARDDRWGNIELRRRGSRSARPIYLIAHMDHPAFVVHEVRGPRRIMAEFRGTVRGEYFNSSPVVLHHADGATTGGRVRCKPTGPDRNRLVAIEFDRPVDTERGAILTWATGRQKVKADRLHVTACDNLAGVAAALSAFDVLRNASADVRVLLTRCEEMGLVGAVGACKAGSIPRRARLIVLESSKSYAESPIGGGPIVRVGDRISTFDPELTWHITQVAQSLSNSNGSFKWQRKLMPGGVCEAAAFAAFGYASACVCLPLGNYHNMNERTGRIAAECISLSDYRHLVRLLTAIGRRLDAAPGAGSANLKARLSEVFERHRRLLGSGSQAAAHQLRG